MADTVSLGKVVEHQVLESFPGVYKTPESNMSRLGLCENSVNWHLMAPIFGR